MKNKIGILTFQDSSNFGSALQTYALWKKVNDYGYDCEIIDYICDEIKKNELPSIKLGNIKEIKETIAWFIYGKYYYKKHNNIFNFLTTNAKMSKDKYYKNNISLTNKIYDTFLVGSDIVWSPELTGEYTYFLDFVNKDKKKISFSSSVGNPFNQEEKKNVKKLISSFEHIAVRESQSKEWIEEISHKKIEVVCDPTMLLTEKEWDNFIGKRIIEEKYVLVYFNDHIGKCLNDAIEYANNNNLKVYFINYGRKKSKFETIRPTTIEEFLNLIKYAECVFTASYHGLLFSIYFNKNFLYYNRAHKSRMESLAKILGIEGQDGSKVDIFKYKFDISWNKINEKVDKFREKSLKVLENELK